MFHYIEDKVFLKNMRSLCSRIINGLVQAINNDDVMRVVAHLVGSGARKLETQNNDEPIDLDYNLEIIDYSNNINNCMDIKEYVKKQFNKVLRKNHWSDCQDSTSVLSTEYRYFTSGNDTSFKIDLAIVYENPDKSWFRLIHEKTGLISSDRWFWNQGPNSQNLTNKVKYIKDHKGWQKVIDLYLDKKNFYLTRNDYDHPSFICYVEAVNEVYNKLGGK